MNNIVMLYVARLYVAVAGLCKWSLRVFGH